MKAMRWDTLLWELRTERGMTRPQLAEMSGVSASHISNIERRDFMPSLETCAKLAKALDVPVQLLVDDFLATESY